MKHWTARDAGPWVAAALPPSAGAPLYFAVPEPWGALLWFYLFLVSGALAGTFMARRGEAGPVALRFGVAFSIPGAVLPFSLLPADGPGIVASTAAAWGLALGAGAGLGAFLSAPRLAGATRSRFRSGLRVWTAFLAGGAIGGAAATLLMTALPPSGYFAAWAAGLIGASAVGGGLLGWGERNA
jgi:hypothetical protein